MIRMRIWSTHRRNAYNCQGETSEQHHQKDAALWKLDKLYSTRAVFLFFFRIALCRAFVQLARKVLAVTFHSIETLNHTNLLDFPHCFSAWETILFETIVFCSNISTRLLAPELARGKVGKQKQGFRSKQEISPSALWAASSEMDNNIPVVSKIFCSGTPTMLMIRRRPIVVNGGGFVVTDLSHNVVFAVDGCGILGSKGEIMVKDGEGEPILFISKKVTDHICKILMHAFLIFNNFLCFPWAKMVKKNLMLI